jgi:uncharacterized RDD family membrane protein YckC
MMQTQPSLATGQATVEVEYPSLLKRYQALFIDLLVCLLLTFATGSVIDRVGEVPDWVRIVTFIAIWGMYEPFCVAFACTIGNLLMGVRVRSVSNQTKRINILQAYLRFFIKFALGWISFLTIHGNLQRRAMHDLAAGSVVIMAK